MGDFLGIFCLIALRVFNSVFLVFYDFFFFLVFLSLLDLQSKASDASSVWIFDYYVYLFFCLLHFERIDSFWKTNPRDDEQRHETKVKNDTTATTFSFSSISTTNCFTILM